jgi:transcription elongation factor Elf1
VEIIPKATIRIDGAEFNGVWDCPSCGAENVIFLLDCQNMTQARAELKAMSIDVVKCEVCFRKFERAT